MCMAWGPRVPLDCCRERVGLCPGRGPSGRPSVSMRRRDPMEVMHERVAGLDIGKATLTVCVRTPGLRGRRSETRPFPTTTRALDVMRDWLLECGVTIAAMESTS